jgi:hypothetical protein
MGLLPFPRGHVPWKTTETGVTVHFTLGNFWRGSLLFGSVAEEPEWPPIPLPGLTKNTPLATLRKC